MCEQYTFQQAVHAIDRATITGRPFPRSLHDNVTADLRDNGERMLLLDWPTAAGRDMWAEFFGTVPPVNGVHWADGWHGWTVVLTAHREGSGAGVRTQAPAPVPATADAMVSALLDPDATIQLPAGIDGDALPRPNWHPEIAEPDRDEIGHGVAPELAARAVLVPLPGREVAS